MSERERLEKMVADAYAFLEAMANEDAEAEKVTTSIKNTVTSLCEFARIAQNKNDYEWATEKNLHLEAILSGRFNTFSGETFPFPGKEWNE